MNDCTTGQDVSRVARVDPFHGIWLLKINGKAVKFYSNKVDGLDLANAINEAIDEAREDGRLFFESERHLSRRAGFQKGLLRAAEMCRANAFLRYNGDEMAKMIEAEVEKMG